MLSGRASSARQITPINFPSTATKIGVLPETICSAKFSGTSVKTFSARIKAGLPAKTNFSLQTAFTPNPVLASNAEILGNVRSTSRFRFCASATTALPSGCSEPCSTAAAKHSISATLVLEFSASVSTVRICVTFGRPSVSVPVLSRMSVSSRCAASRAGAFRNKIPCCAAVPVPTIIAIGVASPKAQGQAITKTATV